MPMIVALKVKWMKAYFFKQNKNKKHASIVLNILHVKLTSNEVFCHVVVKQHLTAWRIRCFVQLSSGHFCEG